jgi:hypothetical protein
MDAGPVGVLAIIAQAPLSPQRTCQPKEVRWPRRLIRMLLIGYAFGIRSKRRLCTATAAQHRSLKAAICQRTATTIPFISL